MNIKQAQYMLVILETGSITNAAKSLCISQSSLSQMIRQIEEEIGAKIFDRSVKPLVPTYAGQVYIDSARQMIHIHDALSIKLSEINKEIRGKLRIGIAIQRGMLFLPLILPAFFEKFPLVEIELEEQGSITLERSVLYGNINLAFVTTENENKNNDLEYRLIEDETLVLFAGRKSKIAANFEPGAPINIIDARDEMFVAVKPGNSIRTLQDTLFRENGISPQILLETNSLETAIRVTDRCDAVTLCPETYLLRSLSPQYYKTFYPVSDSIHRRFFYLCYRKNAYRPRYMLEMIEIACACSLPASSRGIRHSGPRDESEGGESSDE
jgi:DNA-binding transcriptional LysR family regulator